MSESFGGLKDFSVDAQRRMFIEQQERERQAAETKKASRKAKQALNNNDRDNNAVSGVALSGLMSNLENNGNGTSNNNNNNTPKKVNVGEDDDDSIGDDDCWSLDSEESFYVGIERADYAQPNNLEMYGEEKEDDKNYELKEDRFGISRVSMAIINREGNSDGNKGNGGKVVAMMDDWDVDIPIHDEKSSSLHEFMNGTKGNLNNANKASSKKDNFVAMPIVGSSLDWKEESKLTEDDNAATTDQVYEHKAAEGKAFIDKIVNAPSESTTPGKDGGDGEDASTVASMACPPTTPGTTVLMTPGMKTPGGGSRVVGGGNYPVISPMALFSPGLTTTGGGDGGGVGTGTRTKVVEGEDNALRQMRERELRKEASNDATKKMRDFKKMIATKKDENGKVDVYEMMKMLEKMMDE
mmetsp:Transcript_26822/g.42376  ORF Transcript_26822/g.42376 Transcript_26822/m.42376 type:complete len:411 (-) Transcript_26822:209-1441(-)|eukprot:CAMPEP_0201599160 /NCGR_PEP_ID=MMETSP0492-20130828/729_1 /ASSEMBLY_ACC=CAM_ASM_000837 /TAXON_ID=420259 /ORGANISM="Thalassiosira gravida, Strain GMp14c1" /LENGTH=410 /DNA_ID=CAMNT_0048061699 /DNA_START=61 /DNA_END=1293 /DNA_ORIENTATION=-